MNLQDLKKELPYKWRVQSSNQWGATCVAYIDARFVQDLLDEVCGQENWQVKYEEHKGNLFASIGINSDNEWIWKSDCGTESQVEKEKGEASDSFKRACFNWGIGRELYTAPFIWVNADNVALTDKGGKKSTYDKFKVEKITIVDGKITQISIINETKTRKDGKVVRAFAKV